MCLRSNVKLEEGWIWLVVSPRLENIGSSGGNTASHTFPWLGWRLMFQYCYKWWRHTARGGILYGKINWSSTQCVCLNLSNNNLNGLYSGHFTICSILLNSFSLVNLFALCVCTVGVCCFPIPKSCTEGRLCVSCVFLWLGWSILFFKRYELFSLRGGGWYWFCVSERYGLTDWPNNPCWIGESNNFNTPYLA